MERFKVAGARTRRMMGDDAYLAMVAALEKKDSTAKYACSLVFENMCVVVLCLARLHVTNMSFRMHHRSAPVHEQPPTGTHVAEQWLCFYKGDFCRDGC